MEHMIEVSHVKRYYKVAKREQGMGNSIRHLFKRKYEIKRAVDDVSFRPFVVYSGYDSTLLLILCTIKSTIRLSKKGWYNFYG